MLIRKISLISTLILCLTASLAVGQTSTDTTMIVNGVCGMCKTTIETAVGELEGVDKVNWDVDSKVLKVSFDQGILTLNDINSAINKAGYDTEFSTGEDKAYQNLNPCCHYRDPEVVKDHQ